MSNTDLYIAIIVGMALSLLYAELVGVIPAGLVVPGYLAQIFNQPLSLITVTVISLVTFLIVKFGVARYTILYGRRMFVAMLLTAIVVKFIFDYTYPLAPFEVYELRGIGVVVPGLIANTIAKQGLVHTLSSTYLLGGLTFLVMLVYYLF
ncbi:MAG: poly-gamma-glutamate biosynthesis protein PgsC [Bacillota bacterium]